MYCYNCMNEIKAEENYCFHCGKENKADTTAHHLKPGTILNNKFLIGNSIGEGGFGITYVGFDKNLNIRIAVKEYFPSGYANRNNSVSNNVSPNSPKQEEFFNAGKSKFLNEARSLAKFQNEQGIVQVRDFFEENNTAYIVMEYLDGTNLNDYIKSNGALEAEEVFKLMIPIMESLRKIHDIKLIHRDISPDNIMFLKSGKLKLMDFGSARYFSKENNNKSVMVKQGYAPIEQHQSDGNQGPWTDVYGLCATMYKCITGKTPVDSLERYMVDNLKKPSELGISITEPLERVLMYGLAVYHYNRCQNMTELLEITSKALNKQTVIFANENNNTAQNDIYKTQMADDTYKTQIADEYNTETQKNNNTYMGGVTSSPDAFPNTTLPQTTFIPQKKSNKLPIILTIVITVCVMVALGSVMFVIFSLDKNDGNDNENDKEQATTETTVTESTTTIATTTELQTIVMKDYAYSSISAAKSELEGLGINVKIKKVFDENIDKNFVISQYPPAGTEVTANSNVTLTISKGKDICPYDYSQKIVVKSDGSFVLKEWKNGKFRNIFECSCATGSEGIGQSNEHTSVTPEGTFKLGVVFTNSYNGTNVDTYPVDTHTIIVSETNSRYYNQIFDDRYISAVSEPIGKEILDGQYNHMIFIEHNGDGYTTGDSRYGSAITVCGCNGSVQPTYGCIDISASNMNTLLSKLDYSKNPVIEIKG